MYHKYKKENDPECCPSRCVILSGLGGILSIDDMNGFLEKPNCSANVDVVKQDCKLSEDGDRALIVLNDKSDAAKLLELHAVEISQRKLTIALWFAEWKEQTKPVRKDEKDEVSAPDHKPQSKLNLSEKSQTDNKMENAGQPVSVSSAVRDSTADLQANKAEQLKPNSGQVNTGSTNFYEDTHGPKVNELESTEVKGNGLITKKNDIGANRESQVLIVDFEEECNNTSESHKTPLGAESSLNSCDKEIMKEELPVESSGIDRPNSTVVLTHREEEKNSGQAELSRKAHLTSKSPTNMCQKSMGLAPAADQPRARSRKLLVTTPSVKDNYYKSFQTKHGQYIHVVQADITTLKCDVIVSASKTTLDNKTGVSKAIALAAGCGLAEACANNTRHKGRMEIGQTYITPAFALPSGQVIHAAGPFWNETQKIKSKELLKETINNCLCTAKDKCKATSIAVPPIGSGSFKFPAEIAAETISNAVLDFCEKKENSNLRDIIIVDISFQILPMITAFIESKLPDKQDIVCLANFQDRFVSKKNKHGTDSLQTGVQNLPGTISDKSTSSAAGQMSGGHQPIPGDNMSHVSGTEKKTEPGNTEQVDTTQMDGRGSHQRFSANQGKGNEINTTEKESKTTKRTRKLMKAADDNRGPIIALNNIITPAMEGDCAICVDKAEIPVSLPCGHAFCKECIHTWFNEKPTCPCCGVAFGALQGNQPDGQMDHTILRSVKLAGHEAVNGAIEITYQFPGGIQTENHPNPGRQYRGTTRRAYLPNSPEGQEVLGLLTQAFNARLLFTIGRSVTTGKDDQVTWNDVHHKTKIDGGAARFGYPDPNYLTRVKEELAAKGITPAVSHTSLNKGAEKYRI